MRRFWIAMSVIASSALAAASPSTHLTAPEQEELRQRIANFYSGGDMDFRLPKFSARDGRPVAPNAALRAAPAAVTDRLARLGGAKHSEAYRRHWCERFQQR